MINDRTRAWLDEFLADCDRSPRLNEFEAGFIGAIRSRYRRDGAEIVIHETQLPTLRRIEGKIHAAG